MAPSRGIIAEMPPAIRALWLHFPALRCGASIKRFFIEPPPLQTSDPITSATSPCRVGRKRPRFLDRPRRSAPPDRHLEGSGSRQCALIKCFDSGGEPPGCHPSSSGRIADRGAAYDRVGRFVFACRLDHARARIEWAPRGRKQGRSSSDRHGPSGKDWLLAVAGVGKTNAGWGAGRNCGCRCKGSRRSMITIRTDRGATEE